MPEQRPGQADQGASTVSGGAEKAGGESNITAIRAKSLDEPPARINSSSQIRTAERCPEKRSALRKRHADLLAGGHSRSNHLYPGRAGSVRALHGKNGSSQARRRPQTLDGLSRPAPVFRRAASLGQAHTRLQANMKARHVPWYSSDAVYRRLRF